MKNKHKHMDYIQATITRMSEKADMIKKVHFIPMSIILYLHTTPTTYRFASKSIISGIIAMTAITCISMYFDAFFLELERMFIKKYNQTRVMSEEEIDFNMNIYEIKPYMKFSKTLFSVTVFWWYTLILLAFCCGLCLNS